MQSGKLSEMLSHFRIDPPMGNLSVPDSDIKLLTDLIRNLHPHQVSADENEQDEKFELKSDDDFESKFELKQDDDFASLPKPVASHPVLDSYESLTQIFSQIDNVNTRFYPERVRNDLDVAARQIPFTLAMAIFQYAVQLSSKNPDSIFHSVDQYTFMSSFTMPWVNAEWDGLSLQISRKMKNADYEEAEPKLTEIADRYKDEKDFIQANIVLADDRAAICALVDLSKLTHYLELAELLDSADVKMLKLLSASLMPLIVLDNKHTYQNDRSLLSLLHHLTNVRYQFGNQKSQAGFTTQAMTVPAMYVVEAFNESLRENGNSNISTFTPTAEDWADYALRTSFCDSYYSLVRSYPQSNIFPVYETDEDSHELKRSAISYISPREVDALTAIKFDQSRLHNGPSIREVLERVYVGILSLEGEAQINAKKALSVELRRIGGQDSLDPFEVMLSFMKILDGVHECVEIRKEGVTDIETLVKPAVDSFLDTVIDNSNKEEKDSEEDYDIVLDRHYSDENLQKMRMTMDDDLAKKYGMVWILSPRRVELLVQLVSPQTIVDAQNRFTLEKDKKNISLQEHLSQFIQKLLKDEIQKSKRSIVADEKEAKEEKFVVSDSIQIERQEESEILDFENHPETALERIKAKVDDQAIRDFGIAWGWHPEKEIILASLVSLDAIIAAQNALNEERDPNLKLLPGNTLEALMVSQAEKILDAEIELYYASGRHRHAPQFVVTQELMQKTQQALTEKFELSFILNKEKEKFLENLFSPRSIENAIERYHAPIEAFKAKVKPAVAEYISSQLEKGIKWASNPELALGEIRRNTEEALKLALSKVTSRVEEKIENLNLPASLGEWVDKGIKAGEVVLDRVQNNSQELLEAIVTKDLVIEIQNQLNAKKDASLDMTGKDFRTLFLPHVHKIIENELRSEDLYSLHFSLEELEEQEKIDNDEKKSDVALPEHGVTVERIRQKIQKRVIHTLFAEFGVVSVWHDSAVRAINALTANANEMMAVQNRLNIENDKALDIHRVGDLRDRFMQYAMDLYEAEIENSYHTAEDKLEIDNRFVAENEKPEPLDGPRAWGSLVVMAAVCQKMTSQFGILWVARSAEVMNYFSQAVASVEELTSVRERVFKKVVTPNIQKFLDKTLYNEFHHNAGVLMTQEEKASDDETPYARRVLSKTKVLVDSYLTETYAELWTGQASKERLLDELVTEKFILTSQHHAFEARNAYEKNYNSGEPCSVVELSEWVSVFLKKVDEKEDKQDVSSSEDDRIMQNDENQFFVPALSRTETLIKALKELARELEGGVSAEQYERLKASYLQLITLDRLNNTFDDPDYVGTRYTKKVIHQSLFSITEAVSAGLRGQPVSVPVSEQLQKLETFMNRLVEFQGKANLVTVEYRRTYLGLINQVTDADSNVCKLKQAIALFENYTGDNYGFFGYLYNACHLNRHHTETARALINELKACLNNYLDSRESLQDGIDVLQEAKDIIMNRAALLLQNDSLKEQLADSSFARRLAFTMNSLFDFPKYNFNFNLGPMPEYKLKLDPESLGLLALAKEYKGAEFVLPDDSENSFAIPGFKEFKEERIIFQNDDFLDQHERAIPIPMLSSLRGNDQSFFSSSARLISHTLDVQPVINQNPASSSLSLTSGYHAEE